MSSTEFAMVEELASLVEDNLYCKHLVLSKEEAFVNFLQDEASSSGVLVLEPMNSYNRLLLHRLADIFGFSHHSVGEGEDRHLILEQCPETSIPSILVRDLLGQYDEVQSPESSYGSEVAELASLVKDNLPCKHLILSMEDAFVKFLQDETSSNGVLELEPMNSYSRHLLHRLADIFGFSHYSVGEGEDRHLVLKPSLFTLIPSVLVRDILGQYDEVQSPNTFGILSREQEGSDGLLIKNPEGSTSKFSLEEREAAYLAARERIFSIDGNGTDGTNQRPKKDLKVARRMIEHALGQRMSPSTSNEAKSKDTEQSGGQNTDSCKDVEEQTDLGTNVPADVNLKSDFNPKEIKLEMEMPTNDDGVGCLDEAKNEGELQKENFREQHMGAAKRMFTNALGFPRDCNLSKRSLQ